MLQPDPKDRPAMAEIENWSVTLPGRTALKRAESSKPVAAAGAATTPERRWMRYGAAAALVLLLAGSGGAAFYRYVWSVPAVLGARPQGPPDQAPPRPGPPALTPTEPAKEAPATTPAPPADDPLRNDVVRRFVQQYEGGDCFFITPVAIGSSAAVLEGFGASTTPFDVLDKAFKKTHGFEASIGVRMVAPPQCPAITFLNRLRGDSSRTPRIALGSVRLRPGEKLAGNVENFANRVVELLLISDTGQVQNMSYALQPGTDALSFSVEIPRGDDAPRSSVPQLLMAVTTPRVLDSLRQPRPTPADQFFLQAQSEAQRANVTMNASARYFTIQK
jgi:serine/threonine-protein kinase